MRAVIKNKTFGLKANTFASGNMDFMFNVCYRNNYIGKLKNNERSLYQQIISRNFRNEGMFKANLRFVQCFKKKLFTK